GLRPSRLRVGARPCPRTSPAPALRRAVLAELRPGGPARPGRLDRRRAAARALPVAAAQDPLERRAGTLSMKPAVVLVSGGMDSAVVLAIARELGYACHALSVRYGQR